MSNIPVVKRSSMRIDSERNHLLKLVISYEGYFERANLAGYSFCIKSWLTSEPTVGIRKLRTPGTIPNTDNVVIDLK